MFRLSGFLIALFTFFLRIEEAESGKGTFLDEASGFTCSCQCLPPDDNPSGSPEGEGDLSTTAEKSLQMDDDQDQEFDKLVKVSVVYDALCPFSRMFMITSLWNVMKWIPDDYTDKASQPYVHGLWRPFNVFNMLFELLPFGNFVWNEQGEVECQHGQKECDLNHLHACLMKEIGGKKSMNATICTVYHNADSMDDLWKRCVSEEDRPQLTDCMKDDSIVNEITERVSKSNHTFVPWVEINGAFSPDARYHMLKRVCKERREDQLEPPFCDPEFTKKKSSRKLLSIKQDYGVSWRRPYGLYEKHSELFK